MAAHVHTFATVTSKGQVTIPKAVRDALGVGTGDRLAFVVVNGDAVVSKTPDLLDLAGSVKVPDSVREMSFEEIRAAAWAESAKR